MNSLRGGGGGGRRKEGAKHVAHGSWGGGQTAALHLPSGKKL